MDCYSVDIDLGDDLEVGVDLLDDFAVSVELEGDSNCPVIYNIFGGLADSDDPLSSDPFAPINGFLYGGNVFS